jgi:mono/diheme cytochrome c family protein
VSITLKHPAIQISLASVLGAALAAAASATEDQQSGSGWYTAEQADRGHLLYDTYCAECHRPELTGAMGPALIGKPFLAKWSHKTLGDLYSFEHNAMPANNPGSVPEDRLVDITAYILSKNGFPSGTQALAPDIGMDRKLKP